MRKNSSYRKIPALVESEINKLKIGYKEKLEKKYDVNINY